LFGAQLQGANFDGADLSGARVVGDLTAARLRRAKLAHSDCSADEKNQSMGLMRAVFKSANLEEADLSEADLRRADLEFAILRQANLTGASLKEAEAAGADFRGARLSGIDATGADVNSARLEAGQVTFFENAKNLGRAVVEKGVETRPSGGSSTPTSNNVAPTWRLILAKQLLTGASLPRLSGAGTNDARMDMLGWPGR
jgi:uncharacterized protein YjbI with pentapeptide repeats